MIEYYFAIEVIPNMGTTVTAKGQVTIPKPIRELLSIRPGSTVDFELNSAGEVVLRHGSGRAKKRDQRFARLRGTATVKLTTDEIMALTRGRGAR